MTVMSLAHEIGSSVTVWKGENEEGRVRAFSESLYIEILFFLVVQMLLIGAVPGIVLAQKVKVGYDKTTDFSKYKTYTIA